MNKTPDWMGFADDWPGWVRKLVIPFAVAALLAWTFHTLWIVLGSHAWPALTDGNLLLMGVFWFAIPGWIAMLTRVKPAGIVLTLLYGLVVLGWTGNNDWVAFRLGQLKQIDAAYVAWFALDVVYKMMQLALVFYILLQFERRYDRLDKRHDYTRADAPTETS